jgi:hypothetical protein
MGLNKNNAGSKTAGKGFGKIQSMKWKYGNVVKVSAYGDDTGNSDFQFISEQGIPEQGLIGNGNSLVLEEIKRSPSSSPAPESDDDLPPSSESGFSPAPSPSPPGDKPGVLKAKSAAKGRRKSVESVEPVGPSVKV